MKHPELTVSFWFDVAMSLLFAGLSLVGKGSLVCIAFAVLFAGAAYVAFNRANGL